MLSLIKKNIWGIIVISITILAAILRFPLLNEYPVDRDEFARVVPEFTLTSIIPPGIFFLTKFFGGLFNYSDFGYRFPVFIFGVSGILAIYYLGKTLFGKLEGSLAAFILSLLFIHIVYSNGTKEYVPLMFFSSLSSAIIFKILSSIIDKNKVKLKLFLVYILTSFVGIFFSSYFYFLVIVYQIAIILLVKVFVEGKRVSFKKFINPGVAGGIFLILFLGFLMVAKVNSYFGITFIIPKITFITKYWQELGYFVTQDVDFAKATDFLFLLGVGILSFLPKFRRGAFYILSFIVLDFLFVSMIRFKHTAFPIYYIRYHSFLLPLYIVMVAGTIGGIFHFCSINKRKEIGLIVLSIFLLFVLKRSYLLIKWYYTVPESGAITSFKDAGKYLSAHLQKGDTLVRLKNFGMDHKFNHVNHYIDRKVFSKINYAIFPERTAKNNWYTSLISGDEDELGFSDYLYIERIRPSLSSVPTISKLKYYGPFIKTRKLTDKKKWRIEASSGESMVDFMIDGDLKTSWEGEDFKKMTIDLEGIHTLNSVRLSFSELYPQKFTLWLSEDGVTKKEIFNFRSLELDPPNSQIFFPPTEARFIMMELKGSGIREINVWEVYEKKIEGLGDKKMVETDLPGIQIKDESSLNGLTQFIPYDKEEDYTFFQLGNKLTLPKGKYKLSFKIKVDKIVPDWKENLATPPAYRLYEYLEPKDTSDSDILSVSIESTRGTFYNSPAYLNIHGEDFKEANKYYDFSMTFSADGKETLFIQAFSPKHRRYPANLYITYPEIKKIR